MTARSSGSTVTGIKQKELRKVQLHFPKVKNQQAIAHILGSLDDKIDLNRRMNETLEAMARAFFKSWFIDFDGCIEFEDSELGPIPKGWRVGTVTDVINVNPRERLSKGEEAPYVEMKALSTNSARTSKPWRRKFSSGTKFRNGDTLFARITPCLENGKTALVDNLPTNAVGWGSTEFIVMRPKEGVPPGYPYLLARSELFRSYAIKSMTGSSGRQRVQPQVVQNFSLPLPPKDILSQFAGVINPLFAKITANGEQSDTLTELRDTLLPKLISGELRIPVTGKIVGDA